LLDFTSGIREFEELVARVLNGGDPQEIIERIDSRKLDTAFGRVAAASAYNPERPGTSRLEELKEACLNHDNQRIEQFLEAARQAWRERGWM
jgi:hypothetical protein